MFRWALLPRRLLGPLWFRWRDRAKRVDSPHVSFDSRLAAGVVIRPGAVVASCRIGAFTYVNRDAKIYRSTVGPFCSLGPGCVIGPNEHLLDAITTCEFMYPPSELARMAMRNERGTVLDADVWVGAGAVVVKGVRVGVGAAVAAGAVVTRDVEPYAVVGGVPARTLRSRFTEDAVATLVDSRWWELDPERVRRIFEELETEGTEREPMRFAERAREEM